MAGRAEGSGGGADVTKIMRVIDDAVEDLIIFSRLPQSFAAYDPSAYSHLPPTLIEALDEHYLLEEDLEKQMEASLSTPDKSEVLELADLLKESTKQVCRLIKAHGGAEILGPDLSVDTHTPMHRFLDTMQTLRDLSAVKLATSAEDERMRLDSLGEAQRRDERTKNDVAKFRAELEAERQRREREVSEKDELLHRLKDELQYVDEKSKSEQDGFRRLTSERETSQQHVFANELDKWERNISVLHAELATIRERNSKDEADKRQKKVRLENELKNTLTTYDTQMEEMTTENDALHECLDRDSEELDFLRSELERFREEREERERRDAQEHEELQRKLADEKAIQDAAIAIQSIFRGYFFRNKPAKKGKKGKKGAK